MMATLPRVVNAVGDGVGSESAENDGVDGADARAGQHGDGQFRRHAHVDRHTIALLDAQCLQAVGEASGLRRAVRRR